jgi:hypothetical protein
MMRFNKYNLATFIFSALLTVGGTAYAKDNHQHAHDNGHQKNMPTIKGMSQQNEGMFLVKKQVDGYNVSFHVMKAKPGKKMGGSHDFMIKVEKDGKALTDIVMNTKVVHPSGQAENKKTMKMGDWLMAGYDLGHSGEHQMMVLFKTADGEKHKTGIYYPGN